MTQGHDSGAHPSDDPDRPTRALGGETERDDARTHIAALLASRGIRRVVNVDDGNRSDHDRSINLEAVIGSLSAGVLTIDMLAASETTAAIVTDVDGQQLDLAEMLTRLQVETPEIDDAAAKALTDAARLAQRTEESSGTTTSDPPVESAKTESRSTDLAVLSELGDLFPNNVDFVPMTLGQWKANKEEELDMGIPLLILFDRNFEMENASATAGEDLISEVLARKLTHVFCGLLTHSATSDEAEQSMIASVASSHSLDPLELVVISKSAVIHAPLAMAGKLKAAILVRDLTSVRDIVITALTEASKAGTDELCTLDAYTTLSLVEAAEEEGVHEAHNIVRLAASTARRSLDKGLRVDGMVDNALPALRLARGTGPAGSHLPAPADLAARWHNDRFDESEHLASLNLPIEPGDIFEAADPRALIAGKPTMGKRCILLTQICDTIVRSTGHRLGDPKTFTVAVLRRIPEGKVTLSDFRLDWFEEPDAGGYWYARLGYRAQVPVKALDACALSADGAAVIRVGAVAPARLTPGWAKVHVNLQKWATSKIDRLTAMEKTAALKKDVRHLVIQSLTGTSNQIHDIDASIEPSSKVVAFGLRRIGRLTDDDTRFMLTLASHQIGRPAREGNLLAENTPATTVM